jgi:hypothetical protein
VRGKRADPPSHLPAQFRIGGGWQALSFLYRSLRRCRRTTPRRVPQRLFSSVAIAVSLDQSGEAQSRSSSKAWPWSSYRAYIQIEPVLPSINRVDKLGAYTENPPFANTANSGACLRRAGTQSVESSCSVYNTDQALRQWPPMKTKPWGTRQSFNAGHQ